MASKCSTTEEHTVGEAACILHSVILKICKSAPDLPTALSLEDFEKGQVEIPDLLRSFFTTLLTGQKSTEALETFVCWLWHKESHG